MKQPERKCLAVRARLPQWSPFFFQPAVLCKPEVNNRFGIVLLSPFSPVFKVLEDSRQILVAANMRPDDPFPMDDKIKEGLAHRHLLSALSCRRSVHFPFPFLLCLQWQQLSSCRLSVWSLHPCSIFARGGEHGVFWRCGAAFPPHRPPLLWPQLGMGRPPALGAQFLQPDGGLHRRGPPARPHTGKGPL